jgi:asparagine synthetase B (glutamine-hydrolysing)
MPGIAGYFSLRADTVVPPQTLSHLLSPLMHEKSYKVLPLAASASHSAAIVDPGIDDSLCGVAAEQKSGIKVGFYGEFYSDRFRAAVDGQEVAEILLREYLDHGDRLPQILDGSYVVLVKDARTGTSILFNDYCASRPLFYGMGDGVLYFSPEAKGIAGIPGFDATADVDAQVAMLVCSNAIGDHSFYRDVKPLFPGSVLTVRAGKMEPSVSRRYLPAGESTDRGEKYYLNALCDLMLQATAKLLRDVDRIVIPLSGGIDSRMIAGCVHKLTGGNLHTVSWGADEELPGSDAVTARSVADYLKSDHHFIRREAEHLRRDMPEMLYRVDGLITDPVAHSNELNIMRRIRSELGGRYILRGEECFGHASTPSCDAEALAQWGIYRLSDTPCLEEVFDGAALAELRVANDSIYQSLIDSCPSESLTDRREYYYFNVRNFHYHTRSAYCKRTVLDVRNPWMDRDVLEFLNTLPARYRTDRYLYRRATKHMFPDLFEIPVATRNSLENWPRKLREDSDLQHFVRTNLIDSRNSLHELLDPAALGRVFGRAISSEPASTPHKRRLIRVGKEYLRRQMPGLYRRLKPGLMTRIKTREIAASEILLRLVSLKVWYDQFVDRVAAPTEAESDALRL